MNPLDKLRSWILIRRTAVDHGNFGRHIGAGTTENLSHFFESMYASQIVYPISIALTKFSILLFYMRIFKQVAWFRWTCLAIATITGAWLISAVGIPKKPV